MRSASTHESLISLSVCVIFIELPASPCASVCINLHHLHNLRIKSAVIKLNKPFTFIRHYHFRESSIVNSSSSFEDHNHYPGMFIIKISSSY